MLQIERAPVDEDRLTLELTFMVIESLVEEALTQSLDAFRVRRWTTQGQG